MTDALEVARQRKKEYEQDIAKKKSEIEELEEMIGDLESFLEFGQDLVSGGTADNQPKAQAAPQVHQKAQNKSQPKEVAKKNAAAEDPADEWGDPAPQQSIARVLSARNG